MVVPGYLWYVISKYITRQAIDISNGRPCMSTYQTIAHKLPSRLPGRFLQSHLRNSTPGHDLIHQIGRIARHILGRIIHIRLTLPYRLKRLPPDRPPFWAEPSPLAISVLIPRSSHPIRKRLVQHAGESKRAPGMPNPRGSESYGRGWVRALGMSGLKCISQRPQGIELEVKGVIFVL